MKTFNDLVFEPHKFHGGVIAWMDFENGYGVSVIKTPRSYGYEQDLYELAVAKDGDLHYDNPVANGDVVGYLRPEDITDAMILIQNFEK